MGNRWLNHQGSPGRNLRTTQANDGTAIFGGLFTPNQSFPYSDYSLTQDRVLIDVREVHEVEQGSIPSSVNVPLSVLPQAFEQTPDAFRKTYGFDRPEKHQEVIVYCRSGKRSATAADIIWHKGYSKCVQIPEQATLRH